MIKSLLAIALVPILSFIDIWQEENHSSPSEKAVIQVINKTADTIEKKYNITRTGYGVNGDIKFLEICFQIAHPMKKNEARKVLLDCQGIFLSNINSSEKLRPALKNYPFGNENAGIKFFFSTPSGGEIFHPNICVAAINKRGLYFRTDDPENEFRYKETYQETHEEAIAKVKAQHPEFKFGSWEKNGMSNQSAKSN